MPRILRILPLLFILTAQPAIAEIDVSIEQKEYLVSGNSIGAVRAELAAKGPNGFWGLAEWYVQWDGDCNVSLTATITMPRLFRPEQLSTRERAIVDRMIALLQQHEDNHVEFGRVAANEIYAANCVGAYDILNRQIDANNAYDVTTNHGQREGIFLP